MCEVMRAALIKIHIVDLIHVCLNHFEEYVLKAV